MAEYIEKEAVIDEVDEWYDLYPESDTAREALSLLKKAIKKISPEDVRLADGKRICMKTTLLGCRFVRIAEPIWEKDNERSNQQKIPSRMCRRRLGYV